MSISRNTNFPQHSLGAQAHYGDLPLEGMPDATGHPSGTTALWTGTSWYFGTVTVGSGSSTDEKVKVSSNDTTTDYLHNQLSGSGGISLYEYNNGGNELLVISGSTTGSSGTVTNHGSMGSTETFDFSVGSDHEGIQNADLTVTLTGATNGVPAFLTLKLTQDGTGGWDIVLPASVFNDTELEAAWDQSPSAVNILTLFTYDGGTTWYGSLMGGAGGGDTVKVSSNDTTSDYLLSKLVAGSNITLLENNDGGNESITISALISGSAGVYGAGVYPSSNVAISTSGEAAIAWNSEAYDNGGFHDNVTNNTRLTVPTGLGGYYLITANIRLTANQNGYAAVRKNGAAGTILGIASQTVNNTSGVRGTSITTVVQLSAGDYVELYMLSDAANNVQAPSGGPTPQFTINRIGSADELVKVSANDTTPDYLYNQISGSNGITVYEYNNGANEVLVLSGSANVTGYPKNTPIVIGGIGLADRTPNSPGTYDEEWNGAANTLPTDWAWTAAPSGSDEWTLNSRWPSLITVEGTGATSYTLTRTNFSAAAQFGIWAKFHLGPFIAADQASVRLYVSNAGATEQRGLNFRATGAGAAGIRGLRIIASVESVWGTESVVNKWNNTFYVGMTRDGSNNFTAAWFSNDGIAWERLATSQAHTITIDRIRMLFQTSSVQSMVACDWIRYRTDNAFPRP